MSESTIRERLTAYLELKDISKSEFGRRIGVSNAFVTSLKKTISPEKLQKIRDEFPDLNLDWLQFGSGKMILEDRMPEGEGVPFYDMDVTASYVEAFHDVKEEPAYRVNFSPVNDCTAAFPVYGESMAPNISSGDIVFVRELHNKTSFLWGEVYLVITDATCDNMRTIKRVYLSDDRKNYILRADNPLYAGDTVIPVESVIRIYIVKGNFTRKQL